jgi:hypothetical protein
MFLKKLLLASVAMAALVPVAWADDIVASVDDGEYYLYSTNGKFLSRGSNWGTKGAVDNYGTPFTLTTSSNVSVFTFLDNVASLYVVNPVLWADGGSDTDRSMTLVKVNDGVVVKVSSGSYITVDADNVLALTTEIDDATVWNFKSLSERNSIVSNRRLSFINTALSGLNISGITSESALGDALAEEGFVAKDVTSKITNSELNSSVEGWTQIKGDKDGNRSGEWKYGYNVLEVYQGCGSLSQSVTVDEVGLYKVVFQGYQRNGTKENCVTVGNKGYTLGTAYFQANDTYEVIPDWYSDRTSDTNPDDLSDARTSFDNGKYTKELYVYVDESKTINLSVNIPSFLWANWITIDNVKLYYYSADLDEIKNLYNTALSTAKSLAEKAMKKDVLETLNTAISENGSVSSDKAKPYVLATNALNVAIDNATLSSNAYANALSQIEYAETLLSKTNVYTAETKAALDGEIEVAKAAYENRTYTTEEANAVNFTATAAKMLFSTWTRNNTEYSFEANTWSTEGDTDGSEFKVPFVQYWRWWDTLADAILTSTMTDLPEGKYKITMDLRLQKATGSDAAAALSGVSVNVNDGEPVPFSVDKATLYSENSLYIQAIEAYGNVIDGKLHTQIKVESTTAGWVSFKNVKYERVGDVDASAYASTYETSLEKAKSLQSKSMQPVVLAKLNSVVEQYGSLGSSSTADDYKTAIATLNEANEWAEQGIAVTAAGVENTLKLMGEVVASTNVYTQDAVDTYYNNPLKAFNEGTMTVAEAGALQSPYVNTGKTGNVAPFLLSSWDVTSLVDAYYINTWSVEGDNDGSNFKVPFYEYWTDNTATIAPRTLTATVSNLKEGKTYPYGITLQATGGNPVNVCASTQIGTSQLYLDYFSVPGVADEKGELKIQYVVAADNNISWLSFRNVTVEEAVSSEDVQNMQNTIVALSERYEKNVGFQEGEYAPYNNIESTLKSPGKD